MHDVLTTWPVAAFTADVPLRHLLGLSVIVHGMAAIAGWTRGPLHVVRRIQRSPPISTFHGNHVGKPFVSADVPLYRQGEVIISDLCKVALLPETAVDERDFFLGKHRYAVRGQIRNDGVWMTVWITHDVCHWRLFPALVNLGVTLFANWGADVMG